MADKRCVTHGGSNYFSFECPICAAAKEQRKINQEAHERAKELSDRQSKEREEFLRRSEEARELEREERERILEEQREAHEEAEWQRQEDLREADRRQKENLANRYKLESKSKSDQAFDLLSAGSYEGCVKLARSSVDLDPSNSYGFIALSNGLIRLGQVESARTAYLEALSLLKTSRWRDDSTAHLIVLRSLSAASEDLKKNLLDIVERNCSNFSRYEDSLSIVKYLIDSERYMAAKTLFKNVIERASRGGSLNNILISALLAAEVGDSSVAETIVTIPYDRNNEVSSTLREIRSGSYGNYQFDSPFSDHAFNKVEIAIKEVEGNVWNRIDALKRQNSKLSTHKEKRRSLQQEYDAIKNAGSTGCLSLIGIFLLSGILEIFSKSLAGMFFSYL